MATIDEVRSEKSQLELVGLGVPNAVKDSIKASSKVPVVSHVLGLFDAISKRRTAFGLSTPPKFEDFSREVEKEVLTTYYMVPGLRADLNYTAAVKPMFNVMQSFAVGNGRDNAYTFAGIYATNNVFLRGALDSDKALSAHIVGRLSPAIIGRIQAHASDRGTQAVYEVDVPFSDSILCIRAANPSFLDSKFTGMSSFNFSQSITSKLALGISGLWQRQSPDYPAQAGFDLGGRFSSDLFTASGSLSAQGILGLSYLQKFSDKIQGAISTSIDLTGMAAAMAGEAPGSACTTSAAIKMEYPDQSVLRLQADSQYKLAFVLERIVADTMRMTICSEFDQAKTTCKLGLGLQFESQSESVEGVMRQIQTLSQEESKTYLAVPPQ
ncbi:eukaryotic porin-domain-containing protein [Kockiozyma suomiensis]|uniref:eukaryotic porin-domain-containing protein n=1 Tax=Kockiozyma suomiensis TaxID=1337062 RepID=UPI00334386B2